MPALEYQPSRSRVASSSPLPALRLLVFVWAPASMLAMTLGVLACLNYNSVAGIDLTKSEIVGIALSMNTGPLVGPLQGRSVTNPFYGTLIPTGIGAVA